MGTSGQIGSLAGTGAGAGADAALGATAATGVGIPLAVAGLAAQYFAGQNAKKAEQNIQNEEINQQAGLRGQAMGQVGNAAATIANNQANPSAGTLAAQGAYSKAVAGQTQTAGAPAVAGASPKYAAAQKAAVGTASPAYTGVTPYATGLIQSMGATTGMQNTQNANMRAIQNAAANVSALQNESYADAIADRAASSSISANPYAELIGQFAQGAGTSMAMSGIKGLFGGAPTPTPTPTQPNVDGSLMWGSNTPFVGG